MPTYEYRCLKCDHRFEAVQRMTEKPLQACPECRGKVKRLLGTGAGIIFKGSGFYCTDYRKTGASPTAKESDSAASSSKSDSSAKSEPTKTEPAKSTAKT